ncbi:hypothetical protein BT69DRAFT_1281774 [Atractiella rhizophila]|nr:hypothetical protein BT69DRAFT_1281774 [Atractiella rhizophila]
MSQSNPKPQAKRTPLKSGQTRQVPLVSRAKQGALPASLVVPLPLHPIASLFSVRNILLLSPILYALSTRSFVRNFTRTSNSAAITGILLCGVGTLWRSWRERRKEVLVWDVDTDCIYLPVEEGDTTSLWREGSFGKGTLSKSEPTFFVRLSNRLGLSFIETREERTARRRRELGRAKREKKGLPPLPSLEEGAGKGRGDGLEDFSEEDLRELRGEERLQLQKEEAFFLIFGIGTHVLQPSDRVTSLSIEETWDAFLAHGGREKEPDNPFLLSYLVYHHYRSLGWVLRSGIKFCVDWVAYGRGGPAGGHAEFSIKVIPTFSDADKKSKEKGMPWTRFLTLNRITSGVKKTLVLAYVTIPPTSSVMPEDWNDPRRLIRKYKIREVGVGRFSPSRMRD